MIKRSFNVKPLVFIQQDGNSWIAKTPIGRYFIDKEENFEIYSDIEEFETAFTFEEAENVINSIHRSKIKNCLI